MLLQLGEREKRWEKRQGGMHAVTQFDRTIEDIGNVVTLEHVNTRVPDQQLATLFYVDGLGLTRDPYLMTGVGNMWINVGRSQFHLPTGKPQVLRGHTGLVMPDREALVRRLATRCRSRSTGRRFAFSEDNEYVEATCPWGNRIRCYAPGRALRPDAARHALRRIRRAAGTADGIARFYREMLETAANAGEDARRAACARRGRRRPASALPRDRAPAPRLRRPPHRRSISPISPGPIGACSRRA